jgi:hypothetical protein
MMAQSNLLVYMHYTSHFKNGLVNKAVFVFRNFMVSSNCIYFKRFHQKFKKS